MENWRRGGGWKPQLVDGRANLGRVPGAPHHPTASTVEFLWSSQQWTYSKPTTVRQL